MGRSIYCSSCKKEKEPDRKNGYCKACQTKKHQERKLGINKPRVYEKTKISKPCGGLYCRICKALKQDPAQSYCNPCRSVRNKKWTLETGRVQKNWTGLCPCGAERAPNQPYWCSECKAEDSRKWRSKKRTPEEERLNTKAQRDEMAKFKRSVRKITEEYIRRGVLIKKHCEICGENKAEAHHDDYNKPMDIRWLCRPHHLEHHRNERKLIN